MIQRILPFLSQFIPTALAAKGLGKIDPRLSNFFSSAAAAGYGTDAALGFLRRKLGNPAAQEEEQRLEQGEGQGTLRPDEAASLQRIRQAGAPLEMAQKGISALAGLGAGAATIPKAQPEEQQQVQAQPRMEVPGMNTLMAKFPKLGEYLDGLIGNGHPPEQAAGMAKKEARFRKEVNEIENEVGLDFVEFISSIFRGSAPRSAPQAKGGISDKQRAIIDKLKQRLNTM